MSLDKAASLEWIAVLAVGDSRFELPCQWRRCKMQHAASSQRCPTAWLVLRPEEVTRAKACVCVCTPYGIFPLRRLILIPTLCSCNWSFSIASCSPCWPLAFLLTVPLAPFDAFPITQRPMYGVLCMYAVFSIPPANRASWTCKGRWSLV